MELFWVERFWQDIFKVYDKQAYLSLQTQSIFFMWIKRTFLRYVLGCLTFFESSVSPIGLSWV